MAKHYFNVADEHHEIIIRGRKSREGEPLPDVSLKIPPADLDTVAEVNELEQKRRESTGREQIEIAFHELAILAPGCTKQDFAGLSVNTTVEILTRMVELATGMNTEPAEKKSQGRGRRRRSRSSKPASG